MTPERAAAIAATRLEIAERFTHYGIPDPDEKADALLRWMQRNGWRVHLELVDNPPAPRREPSNSPAALAARAQIRELLAERRPESHGGER